MAANVNLLPKELAPSESVTKLGKVLNTFALGLTGLFVVAAVAGGITLYLLNNRLNDLSSEQTGLKNSITNLQTSESQLILLKDRVGKIQTLLALRTGEALYDKQKGITNSLLPDMALTKNEISQGKSTIELSSNKSKSISDLMSIILSNTQLANLIMQEMTFNPYVGYKIVFELF